MRLTIKNLFSLLGILTLITSVQSTTDERSAAAWSVNTDAAGAIVSLTYVDPPSFLQIENEVVINFDKKYNPTSGVVKLKGGVSRELKPGEITMYMEFYRGLNRVWDYLFLKEKLSIFKPKDGQIATSQFKQDKVRLITNTDKEFIGEIMYVKDNQVFMSLSNACCGPISIENTLVREIQQIAP